jgi:hypothetical protein
METADKHSRFGKINAFANILPHMGDVKEMAEFHHCHPLVVLHWNTNATESVRNTSGGVFEACKTRCKMFVYPGKKGVGLGWSSRHSLECRSVLFNHRTE